MRTNAQKNAQLAAIGRQADAVSIGLAKAITSWIEDAGLTQTEASYVVGDAPSQLSLISTGKLRGFSEKRLMRILAMAGRNVEIIVRPSGKTQGRITLTVER